MTAERETDRPAASSDDGQPDRLCGGHAEVSGGGQCDYLV
jgi:hypothetical protein